MKVVLKILSSCALFLTVGALQADEVLVAVSANFTGAAKALSVPFEQQTGHSLKISYGSTGKLYAQIINGAPFEVFLAADSKHPEKLEASGLAVPGSRFSYARGRLVLWSANARQFDNGEHYLRQGEYLRLAMAIPKQRLMDWQQNRCYSTWGYGKAFKNNSCAEIQSRRPFSFL